MRTKNILSNKEYTIRLMNSLRLCCPPHQGCNRVNRNRWTPYRNWKKYRKHQWKEKTEQTTPSFLINNLLLNN